MLWKTVKQNSWHGGKELAFSEGSAKDFIGKLREHG